MNALGWLGGLALLLTGASSSAQSVTPEGAARTASLYGAIAQHCPAHLRIDRALADKLGQAGSYYVIRTLPTEQAGNLIIVEMKRRFAEVQATGEGAWCAYQRDVQRARRIAVFLN